MQPLLLSERIIFGPAAESVSKIPCLTGGRVAVATSDGDYFNVGMGVAETLRRGNAVSVFSVDDDCPDLEQTAPLFDFAGFSAVVAVGKSELINAVRYFADKHNVPVIVVPTVVAFSTAFSVTAKLKRKGIYSTYRLPSVERAVVDLGYISGLKKQAFADAFAELAAFNLAVVDYEAECAVSMTEPDKRLTKGLVAATSRLAEIKSEGATAMKAVIRAELAAAAIFDRAGAVFGAEFAAAKLLSKANPAEEFENRFGSVTPLIALYEAFLRIDLVNSELVTDYNAIISELSEMSGGDEETLLQKYSPLEIGEIIDCRERLRESGLLAEIKRASALNDRLKAAYGYVYRGRHRRANDDYRDLLHSLRLAGAVSGGILRLVTESGALENE